MIPTPLRLLGSPGSPYTRKMLAALRYRRIAYALIIGSHRDRSDLPQPKVALLPTFYLPDGRGGTEAVVDSTPLIRLFEDEFPERRLVSVDPAIAFLDYLLEDFADEWLTKAMFHYRWRYDADADHAAEILPRWSAQPRREQDVAAAQRFIRERQVSRLYVVGSNDVTAPVIEGSYRRYLSLLKTHLEAHPFLFGARPSASDFAAYGQLTQLVKFDPTPRAIALEEAPRVFAWVDVVDDLSGLEVAEDGWLTPSSLPQTLRDIFAEAGRVYAPVMLANANAVRERADKVSAEVDGLPWVQEPFPYQARCVAWIRERFAALDPASRAVVLSFLDGTGCEPLLAHSEGVAA